MERECFLWLQLRWSLRPAPTEPVSTIQLGLMPSGHLTRWKILIFLMRGCTFISIYNFGLLKTMGYLCYMCDIFWWPLPYVYLYIVINEQLPKIGERSKTLSDSLPKHSFKLIVVRNLVSEKKVLIRKYVSFDRKRMLHDMHYNQSTHVSTHDMVCYNLFDHTLCVAYIDIKVQSLTTEVCQTIKRGTATASQHF